MVQDFKCNMKFNKMLFFGSPLPILDLVWNEVHFMSIWCETKVSQTQTSGDDTWGIFFALCCHSLI